MTGPLRIRPLASGDQAAWAALWAGYNGFYGRAGETALPDLVTQTTWARFFDDGEPVHALVADSGGRLVGLAHYIFHRSTTMIGPNCYLQDLFTAQDARGMGVGRALIDAICQRARAAGGTRVYWQTHETNAPARRLYDSVAEHAGFIVYRKDL